MYANKSVKKKTKKTNPNNAADSDASSEGEDVLTIYEGTQNQRCTGAVDERPRRY
jgi:hypothetical protein